MTTLAALLAGTVANTAAPLGSKQHELHDSAPSTCRLSTAKYFLAISTVVHHAFSAGKVAAACMMTRTIFPTITAA